MDIENLGFETINLGHGSGGELTRNLLDKLIFKTFSNPFLNQKHDGAIVKIEGEIAISTDSFVITPVFFKGGNIGELAVHGTVNDVASAMVTSMNRVNGVYENEVAIRMIIIANNSSLIFVNGTTDGGVYPISIPGVSYLHSPGITKLNNKKKYRQSPKNKIFPINNNKFMRIKRTIATFVWVCPLCATSNNRPIIKA